jgi:hypothetical protein
LIEVLEPRFLVGAVAGVWVQLNAVLVGGLDYVLLLRARPLEREALFVSSRDRVDIEDMRLNPRSSEIAGNWILVRHLLQFRRNPARGSRWKRTVRLYTILCRRANGRRRRDGTLFGPTLVTCRYFTLSFSVLESGVESFRAGKSNNWRYSSH